MIYVFGFLAGCGITTLLLEMRSCIRWPRRLRRNLEIMPYLISGDPIPFHHQERN